MSKRPFAHDYTTPVPKRIRAPNHETLLTTTPATPARPHSLTSPRVPSTPSAFDLFPAHEFQQFVQGIKYKAALALQENAELDVALERERRRQAEKEQRLRDKQALLERLVKAREEEAEAVLDRAIEEAKRPVARKQPPKSDVLEEQAFSSAQASDESEDEGPRKYEEDDDEGETPRRLSSEEEEGEEVDEEDVEGQDSFGLQNQEYEQYSDDELAEANRSEELSDDQDDGLQIFPSQVEMLSSDNDEYSQDAFEQGDQDNDDAASDDDQYIETEFVQGDDRSDRNLTVRESSDQDISNQEEHISEEADSASHEDLGIDNAVLDPALSGFTASTLKQDSDLDDVIFAKENRIAQLLPKRHPLEDEDGVAEVSDAASDAVPDELIPVFDDDDEAMERSSAELNEEEDRYDNEPEEAHVPIDVVLERGDELTEQDILDLRSPVEVEADFESDTEYAKENHGQVVKKDASDDIKEAELPDLSQGEATEELLFKEMDRARRLSQIAQARPDLRRASIDALPSSDQPNSHLSQLRRSSDAPREPVNSNTEIEHNGNHGLPPRRTSDATRRPSMHSQRPFHAEVFPPSPIEEADDHANHHSVEETILSEAPAEEIVEDPARILDASEKGFHVARDDHHELLAVQDKSVEAQMSKEVPPVTEDEQVVVAKEAEFLAHLDGQLEKSAQLTDELRDSNKESVLRQSSHESISNAAAEDAIVDEQKGSVEVPEQVEDVAMVLDNEATNDASHQSFVRDEPDAGEIEANGSFLQQTTASTKAIDESEASQFFAEDIVLEDIDEGDEEEATNHLEYASSEESQGMQGDLGDFIAEDADEGSARELMDDFVNDFDGPDDARQHSEHSDVDHVSAISPVSAADKPIGENGDAEQAALASYEASSEANEDKQTSDGHHSVRADSKESTPIKSSHAVVAHHDHGQDVHDDVDRDEAKQRKGSDAGEASQRLRRRSSTESQSGSQEHAGENIQSTRSAVKADHESPDMMREGLATIHENDKAIQRLQTPPPLDNPESILHSPRLHPPASPIPVIVHRLRDGAEYVDDSNDLSTLEEHDESHHLPAAIQSGPRVVIRRRSAAFREANTAPTREGRQTRSMSAEASDSVRRSQRKR